MIKVQEFLSDQTVEAARQSPCIHDWVKVVTFVGGSSKQKCTARYCVNCSFTLTEEQFEKLEKSNDTSTSSD